MGSEMCIRDRVNLVYSEGNRSAAVRIPLTGPSPKAKRLEFRSGDALANPYLAFSVMMLAVTRGNYLKKKNPFFFSF